MKFLSPSDYLLWPSFTQRICFAYNTVSHASLADIFPFEMDYGGTTPVSAFAPPEPDPPHPLDDNAYDDSQQGKHNPTPLTPALAAAAIQVSVAAFHR